MPNGMPLQTVCFPLPFLLSLVDPLKYKLVLIIYILMGTRLVLKAV
jgi:hypothetical protein